MSTLFTQIIDGEIPGRFVWRDEVCVAFLTIAPITPGHTLVIPRAEVEQWTELDTPTLSHLFEVAQVIGQAQQVEWRAPRIGVLLEGFEVPHTHVHVWPATSVADFEVHAVDHDPDPEAMEQAQRRLTARLRAMGRAEATGE